MKVKVLGFYNKDDGFNSEFEYNKMNQDNKKGTVINPIKFNKPKNNYSKLRRQKNSLQNRLNMANDFLKIKTNEITRLLNVLDTEQRINQVLENRINLEVEEKKVALEKLKEANKQKDSYYDWYLKEIDKKNKTENKLIIGLTISIFVITALVVILIKGL